MTWNVGASYFLCKSGNFAISSLTSQLEFCLRDLLRKIELSIHLLILWPLGDEEGIPRCSLSDRRVEAKDKLNVEVVDFGEKEDTMDGGEGYSIVGTLPQ